MSYQIDELVYDDWSLLNDDTKLKAEWINVSAEQMEWLNEECRLLVLQNDVQEEVRRCVEGHLYKGLNPPPISVDFRMVEMSTPCGHASQEPLLEHTPALVMNIQGDFDGVLRMRRERDELGLPDPAGEDYEDLSGKQKLWRTKTIEVDYCVGQIFKSLRNYPNESRDKLRTMTYIVRFSDNDGYYTYSLNSAIKIIYHAPAPIAS
ncbi:hypothetical protein F4824DRAFT_495146 [Ustulina deusta]|nr:hypothetical protein F4824DRAFT_495146 [Ustulina deusta]